MDLQRNVVAPVLERITPPLVRGLAALPTRLQHLMTPRGLSPRDGQDLLPEVGMALRLLRLSGPSFETFPPIEARQIIRQEAASFAGPQVPVRSVQDRTIPGPGGEIGLRLYDDRQDRSGWTAGIVFFHGGGWVVGDLETHDPFCRFLARGTGYPVIAVDYRLAPEHPFPAAVDDAAAAFAWTAANAGDLGLDPSRLAVAGDSAGGTLATVVCQSAADEGGPVPALQVLIYPVTDLSLKHDSYPLFAEGYFLTEAQMDWYRDHYTGGQHLTDPRVSPLLAEDLSGLPPAYVTTAGFDVLRDEGEAYARRLQSAGVDTTLRRHPGLVHSWINAVGLGRGPRSAADEIVDALRQV